MTPKEAACVIGCSPSHVRHLIRQGSLEVTGYYDPLGNIAYDVSCEEARRYNRKKQKGGWPRGQSR